jgi:thioredoxin 2
MKATESQFRETLEKAKVPVVADFFADWCGPCRAFAPIFEQAAKNLAPDFSLCMVNIDEASSLAEEVGVRVVPTIMVFDETRLVATHEGGFASASELETFIRDSVKK